MKKYSNYFIIILAAILIFGNLYENNFQIDRSNIWRLVSSLCLLVLGIYNLNLQKNENSGIRNHRNQ